MNSQRRNKLHVSSRLPVPSALTQWPQSTVIFEQKTMWAPESSWTLWRVERFSSPLIRPMVPRSSILHCIPTQRQLEHYIIKCVSLVINQNSSSAFQVLTQTPSGSPYRAKTDTDMQSFRSSDGGCIYNDYTALYLHIDCKSGEWICWVSDHFIVCQLRLINSGLYALTPSMRWRGQKLNPTKRGCSVWIQKKKKRWSRCVAYIYLLK